MTRSHVTRPHVAVAAIVASALLAPLAACPAPEDVTYDPDEQIAIAVDYESLERMDINRELTSHKNLADGTMSIWANESAAEIFRTLDPLDLEQEAEFPPGAMLVKTHYDLDDNQLDELLVLVKFEAGYNPPANDWFFARTDLAGNVLDGHVGHVEFCADCHDSMAGASDYVIGLPEENQR